MKIECTHKYVDGKGEEQSYSNIQEIVFKGNYLEYIKSIYSEREEWFSIIKKESIVDLHKKEYIDTSKQPFTVKYYTISIKYIKYNNVHIHKEIVFNLDDKDKWDKLYKQLKDWIK
jgi:hypothetical protein